LTGPLEELLEDISLAEAINLRYFQLDGAPSHFAREVRQWLDLTYPDRWIGRGGPVPVGWPSRLPDITPLDFFFWGHCKEIVYRTMPNTEEELRGRIITTAATVTPEMLERVHGNIVKKVNACLDANGQNFKHLL
jgi:hypothetical protein